MIKLNCCRFKKMSLIFFPKVEDGQCYCGSIDVVVGNNYIKYCITCFDECFPFARYDILDAEEQKTQKKYLGVWSPNIIEDCIITQNLQYRIDGSYVVNEIPSYYDPSINLTTGDICNFDELFLSESLNSVSSELNQCHDCYSITNYIDCCWCGNYLLNQPSFMKLPGLNPQYSGWVVSAIDDSSEIKVM